MAVAVGDVEESVDAGTEDGGVDDGSAVADMVDNAPMSSSTTGAFA